MALVSADFWISEARIVSRAGSRAWFSCDRKIPVFSEESALPDRKLPGHIRLPALIGIAAVSSALLTTPASAVERVVDGTVAAEVIGVVPLRAAGRGLPWRARVTVRLDDGLRVRLTYRRPFPRVGERVQLRMSNGELEPVRPSR